MRMTDAIDEFVEERRSTGRAPATLRFYKGNLNRFASFCAKRDLLEIADLCKQTGKSAIRAFFGHLYDRHFQEEITESTISAYDRALRAFCSFSLQEGWIGLNPMANRSRIDTPRSLPDTLTFDEIRALLATCPPQPTDAQKYCINLRDRALLLLMLDTGLRANEVCSLTLKDVTLYQDRGMIRVQADNSKGKKERRVPIWTETAKALRDYLQVRPAKAVTLFVSAVANAHSSNLQLSPITPNGLNQIMRRRAEQAGIEDKSKWCHIWRHTFAKNYILANGDLETLRRLLGHKSLDTVRIYLDFRTKDLELKHWELSPVRQLFEGDRAGQPLEGPLCGHPRPGS